MNFLITGGAGFIGAHLCKRLLQEGHNVSCLDNLSLGKKAHIALLKTNENFSFIHGDVLDKDLLEKTCRDHKIEGICHMAANSDIQAGSQSLDRDLNTTFRTTVACLDCVRKFKIKKIIFASSSAVYGRFDTPMKETDGPCRPVSFYGAAKLASENYIHAMQEQADFKAWIIRFPNVVGPQLTHGVIYDFIRKLKKDPTQLEILGDGKQCKPYIWVDDLINGILVAQEHLSDAFNVINLGVESATSVTDIAKTLVAQMGLTDVAFNYTGGEGGWAGDVPRFSYDLSLMKSIGIIPTHTSDESIRACIKAELAS